MPTVISAGQSSESASDEYHVSLGAYLDVLKRRKRLLMALPVAFALIGGALAFFSTRHYEASAAFAPEEAQQSGASGIGALAAQFGIPIGRSSSSSPAFYADLVKRREILKQVVLTQYDVGGAKPFKGNLVSFYGLESTEEGIREAIAQLNARTFVGQDRSTGVITIEVQTPLPGLSQAIVNRLLDLIVEYNQSRRRALARTELDFINEQLGEAESRLRAAQSALAAFEGANRSYEQSATLRAEHARLFSVVSIRQQLYLSLAQGREASRMEAARNMPIISIIDRPEGFVEPVARGTVRQAILGFIVGALLGVTYVFLADYLQRLRALVPQPSASARVSAASHGV